MLLFHLIDKPEVSDYRGDQTGKRDDAIFCYPTFQTCYINTGTLALEHTLCLPPSAF